MRLILIIVRLLTILMNSLFLESITRTMSKNDPQRLVETTANKQQ